MVNLRRKLVWLSFLPLQVVAALAYLENNIDIQYPPSSSNACIDNPDANNFLIRYINPECLPKWRFWFRDPVFNSLGIGPERVMRMTDALSIGVRGASHVYSSVNPFNQAMTKMIIVHRLLQGGDSIAIYDIAGGTYSLTPPRFSVNWQPRWSRTDPNIVYVMPSVSPPGPVYIKQYDVSTGILSNVGGPLSFNGHTYDSTVSHPAEDDICFGGDHLIKRVRWQGIEYVVVFSISQQTVVGEFPITGLMTGDGLDSVELAPAATAADRSADRNDIVLLNFAWHESSGSFNTWGRGIWKFTFDESRPPAERIFVNQQAATANEHHDIGMDDDGSPVLVMPNGSMFNPLAGCQGGGRYGIEKFSLVNPDGNLPTAQRSNSRCLMNSLDWASLGVHVSLGDQAGWAYLDVFRPSSSDTPGNPDPLANWKPYTNEIIQVKLDGASVRRLAHARARLTNQWYNQPVASISRDGRTLAFVSNFGYGNYDVTQYNDVYLIQPIHLGSGAPVYTLSVNKTGNGSGVVSSDPAGIDCGTVCSADFVVGTLVTLNSLADTGSAFSGWSGACSGAGSCVVTMNAAQSVTATFTTVAPTWTRVEQASSDVTWVGNWPNNSSSLHSGGSARRGRVAGNLSTFSFTGTSARWIGYNDALSGLARVYLDGVLQTQVDTYAGATQPQQINYTTPALASGSHTLTIEVSGAKNSGSKNNWIYVDAFEFTP